MLEVLELVQVRNSYPRDLLEFEKRMVALAMAMVAKSPVSEIYLLLLH